jgi:hypothetical protein
MNKTTLLTLIIACSSAWIASLSAAEQRLLASDGAAGDSFGCSVGISGDYAIVGASRDDDLGSSSGSAYVFYRVTIPREAYLQQAKLTASDGAAEDLFGHVVAISGDYAIVGARGDDDLGSSSGSAYVFHRDGTSWTEHQKLTADDGEEGDLFGYSVAISGNYAIVGACGDDDLGSSSGSAYLFRRAVSTDFWLLEAKLTAADGDAADRFGDAVGITDDLAVVGADEDDDNGDCSGSAYVYRRDGTTWTQEAKLTADDGASGDWFGGSIGISGDRLVIGAVGDDDHGDLSGSAYVFRWLPSPAGWSQVAKLLTRDGKIRDLCGYAVAIAGDHVVVGCQKTEDPPEPGAAYGFRQDDAVWVLDGKVTAYDGEPFDLFGVSVAMSEDFFVIGAAQNDTNGVNAGAAYAYAWSETDWWLFRDGFETSDTSAWSATVP